MSNKRAPKRGPPGPPSCKRGRPQDADEIFLDNMYANKRYLTEVMAASMDGLRVAEGSACEIGAASSTYGYRSPSRMDSSAVPPTFPDTPSGSASPFASHNDDQSAMDSAMSEDSVDSLGWRSICAGGAGEELDDRGQEQAEQPSKDRFDLEQGMEQDHANGMFGPIQNRQQQLGHQERQPHPPSSFPPVCDNPTLVVVSLRALGSRSSSPQRLPHQRSPSSPHRGSGSPHRGSGTRGSPPSASCSSPPRQWVGRSLPSSLPSPPPPPSSGTFLSLPPAPPAAPAAAAPPVRGLPVNLASRFLGADAIDGRLPLTPGGDPVMQCGSLRRAALLRAQKLRSCKGGRATQQRSLQDEAGQLCRSRSSSCSPEPVACDMQSQVQSAQRPGPDVSVVAEGATSSAARESLFPRMNSILENSTGGGNSSINAAEVAAGNQRRGEREERGLQLQQQNLGLGGVGRAPSPAAVRRKGLEEEVGVMTMRGVHLRGAEIAVLAGVAGVPVAGRAALGLRHSSFPNILGDKQEHVFPTNVPKPAQEAMPVALMLLLSSAALEGGGQAGAGSVGNTNVAAAEVQAQPGQIAGAERNDRLAARIWSPRLLLERSLPRTSHLATNADASFCPLFPCKRPLGATLEATEMTGQLQAGSSKMVRVEEGGTAGGAKVDKGAPEVVVPQQQITVGNESLFNLGVGEAGQDGGGAGGGRRRRSSSHG